MVTEVKLSLHGLPKRKLTPFRRKLALTQINQNKRDDEQSYRHSFSRPVPQPPSENDEIPRKHPKNHTAYSRTTMRSSYCIARIPKGRTDSPNTQQQCGLAGFLVKMALELGL